MKRLKKYPEHKCCNCRNMTTNKSYCNACLAIYMKPPFTPPRPPGITASPERVFMGYRRNESINKHRG